MSTTVDSADDVLAAIQQRRTDLERDVEDKRTALEEAETRLSAFRANALSALGAASGSKSAQKQRAERQAVVAQLLAEGLSRAEIVRRTGLVDHLVGYDIDCIRKRRNKQGTKRVFAKGAAASPAPPAKPSSVEREEAPEEPEVDDDDEDDDLEDEVESGSNALEESSGAAVEEPVRPPKAIVEPRRPGVVPHGAAASREQLKALAKSIQRGGGKACRLMTTVDSGHSHVVVLDLMGDGETVKDETGHKHRACRFEMLESDHLHGITLVQSQK